MVLRKTIVTGIILALIPISLPGFQHPKETNWSEVSRLNDLEKQVELLCLRLDPNPFDKKTNLSALDKLLACLNFEETDSDAIELLIGHSGKDKKVAQRLKSYLQELCQKEAKLGNDEINGIEIFLDVSGYGVSSILEPLLVHPETRSFAAPLLFEDLESCLELHKSSRLLIELGKHKEYRDQVLKLTADPKFSNSYLRDWIRFQLQPTSHANPIQSVFDNLKSEKASEFFGEIELCCNEQNIQLVKRAIEKSRGNDLVLIQPAIEASGDRKWHSVIAEYLNSKSKHTVRAAIESLTEFAASDPKIQKSIARIYEQTDSVTLKMWVLNYFAFADCLNKDLTKPFRRSFLEFDEKVDYTNKEQIRFLQYLMFALTNQKIFDEKVQAKMLKLIHHRHQLIACHAFYHLCQSKYISDFAVDQVMAQFKLRPEMGRFIYLGMSGYQYAGPYTWLKLHGKKIQSHLEKLLRHDSDAKRVHVCLELIFEIDPGNAVGLKKIESILGKSKSKTNENATKDANIDQEDEYESNLLKLYLTQQKQKSRVSDFLKPLILAEIRTRQLSKPSYIRQIFETGGLKAPINSTQALKAARIRTSKKSDTKSNTVPNESWPIALPWIQRCQKIDGDEFRKAISKFLNKNPQHPIILDILAQTEDRNVISNLLENLTYEEPKTGGDEFGIVINQGGGVVPPPQFRHNPELTKNGQAAISLTHYREFFEPRRILAKAHDALKISTVTYDDRVAIAELILKLDPENKRARKIITSSLDSSPETRFQTCLTCARLGRNATFAIPHLNRLKADYLSEVRRAALKALKRIDDDTP